MHARRTSVVINEQLYISDFSTVVWILRVPCLHSARYKLAGELFQSRGRAGDSESSSSLTSW